MNKTKWIVGLTIVGVMALSGTAFALTSGSVAGKSVGQTLGLAPIVSTTQNQGTAADAATTPSSPKINSNAVATPGFNGNGGGYGMKDIHGY